MIRFQTDDCLTPEEEAEIEARYLEEQEHKWLQSWADDFYSDAWANEADRLTAPVRLSEVA